MLSLGWNVHGQNNPVTRDTTRRLAEVTVNAAAKRGLKTI
jgi:iron complex outermembrane receptor protein